MGAEITWLGPVDPADAAQPTTTPAAAPASLAAAPTLATARMCDGHTSAYAEYVSDVLDLAFCGHCARYGAARDLPLLPLSSA